jgi:deazaflavin-dependent oxidoreductase (nitroreductase family)
LSPLLKRLLGLPALLYRLRLGVLLDHRFLLLRHRGRKSGRLYETVLEVVHRDRERDELVVMSGFGRGSSWFRNVEAGGAVEVRCGNERFRPEARVLPPEEAAACLAGYERRNRVVSPVVRRVLSRLAGFPYTGDDAGRLRLVETLPLVGLRKPQPPS